MIPTLLRGARVLVAAALMFLAVLVVNLLDAARVFLLRALSELELSSTKLTRFVEDDVKRARTLLVDQAREEGGTSALSPHRLAIQCPELSLCPRTPEPALLPERPSSASMLYAVRGLIEAEETADPQQIQLAESRVLAATEPADGDSAPCESEDLAEGSFHMELQCSENEVVRLRDELKIATQELHRYKLLYRGQGHEMAELRSQVIRLDRERLQSSMQTCDLANTFSANPEDLVEQSASFELSPSDPVLRSSSPREW